MSDYVVESGASSRARVRRRRTLITLGLVALLLFGAFWFAYSYWKQPPPPSAVPAPSCTTAPRNVAPVKVNVYNATSRNGLAASTANALKKRGFVIGTVANDPLKKTITGTAEVRYGTSGSKAALSILDLVPTPTKVVDARKDTSVDLVLGIGFKALVAGPPSPSATSTVTVCAPTTTAPVKKPTTPTSTKKS